MLKVADTTTTPGGRFRTHGPDSGEAFRDDVLRPALERAIAAGQRLTVDLDGVEGYAASWLDEAFGGLALELGSAVVLEHLEVKATDDPTWRDDALGWVRAMAVVKAPRELTAEEVVFGQELAARRAC